jgi:hypothetical protein
MRAKASSPTGRCHDPPAFPRTSSGRQRSSVRDRLSFTGRSLPDRLRVYRRSPSYRTGITIPRRTLPAGMIHGEPCGSGFAFRPGLVRREHSLPFLRHLTSPKGEPRKGSVGTAGIGTGIRYGAFRIRRIIMAAFAESKRMIEGAEQMRWGNAISVESLTASNKPGECTVTP